LCNPEQKHYRSWFCVSKYVVVALNGTLNTQSAPSDFMASSGMAVPTTLKIKPAPSRAASAVPTAQAL
jgi:hypothetical protein